ncbi:LysE family translocator [Hydrogenophaga pseudoflava]|uniref:LysE family translocator n=1 Tax=Hydrogenophaga pseudoflava TaxID=47421 RepID=UPI0027E4BB63|nr:LysE family translocator [Hydrogenophaga pseudoflava]MDQ7746043.1 LysE family translocator [Hydrogenophaga pseudoflava]
MENLILSDLSHLWLFFVLVLGIIALPGMDMAFVLGSTLADGRQGGAAALAGVVAGGVAHTVMAALGVGLVLQSVPGLFTLMLVGGALYLGWIGASLVRGASALGEVGVSRSRPVAASFRQGLLTCLLNPKAYLFMVAVFPQFARPELGPVLPQAVAMGAIVAVTQAAVYGLVVLGADRAQAALRGSGRAQVGAMRGVGLVLMGGAAWMLWHGLVST